MEASRSEIDLITLLKKCEVASRPISFETIDLVQQNPHADKVVLELTGKEVDDRYRQMKSA